MATVGTERHPAVLRREDTGLIVVDVQEAFRPVIDAFDDTVRNCGILRQAKAGEVTAALAAAH